MASMDGGAAAAARADGGRPRWRMPYVNGRQTDRKDVIFEGASRAGRSRAAASKEKR